MPITAHGVTIDATASHLVLEYSELSQALGAPQRRRVALDKLTDVTVTSPGEVSLGTLVCAVDGDSPLIVHFAPGSDPRELVKLIDAAQSGEIQEATSQIDNLDFTALDVETANDSWGSICQIGVVRFRNGQETHSRTWLCKPPEGVGEFAPANVAIHGITAEDVQEAPEFAEILPEVTEFVGSDVVVAHNAQFDSTALRQAALHAGVPVPSFPLACSLALARDGSKNGIISVKNHRLPTVNQAVGGKDFQHHDATADARAAGEIIVGLAKRHKFQGTIEELFQRQGLVLGALSQARVMPVLREHTAPRNKADLGAGTDFRDLTSGAQKKQRQSPAPWSGVSTPSVVPDTNPDADPNHPLFGQNVTLTGDFEPFDKGTLWQGIAEHGATVGKSVTKKTTVLVLGTWGSKTSKEKRAEELQAKGQDISLWSKEKLFELLNLEEQEPPF